MSAPTLVRLRAWLDAKRGDYTTKDAVDAFLLAERSDNEHAAELDALADRLVRNALMQHAVSYRTSQRSNARRSVMRDDIASAVGTAAENLAAGHRSGLFGERHVVDDKGTLRVAAEMSGADHRYVAAHYADRSKRMGLFAAFHRAVARRLGHQRTDEVYTSDAYETLYRNITAAQQARRNDAA